ncbi:DUF1302 domain-containing protein [Aliikangiella marina]|nr:DUF1302 domain-containing protein [Aliikangiella marina]
MYKPKLAGVALAVAVALSAAQPAQAVDINTDNWSGSWDTTISFGATWRVEDRDESRIGHSNLAGLGPGGLAAIPGSNTVLTGGWSNNGDAGNLNFDQGEMVSRAIKYTTELGLEHTSGFGFFIRSTGFYDFELHDRPSQRVKPITEAALDEQGQQNELLDAYVYFDVPVGDSSLQARLGSQVISWGESTLIQHGLSEINAVDVTKLRIPGSEIKEALIPVNTVWASVDLTDTISLEAFAQTEWEHFRTDEPGTYFASTDFAGETGTDIHLGFGQFGEGTPGTVARRLADRDAKDDGQFGIKLGWLAEDWNYTEFGFYYVNYHNKRPVISTLAHNGVEVQGYFEYLEDIEMYALSFNTSSDLGFSLAGEVTYRIDEPLQIDDVELLFAALEPVGSIPSGTSQIPAGAGLGDEISGYRLFDTTQAQLTMTAFAGPTWGADQLVILAEVGANWITDLPSEDELRFEAPGTSRSGNPDRQTTLPDGTVVEGSGFIVPGSPCSVGGAPVACEGVTPNDFASDFSWGYRLVARFDYSDVFAGWNMSPRIVFSHDVDGTTPAPIGNFVEGRKAVTLGVSMDLQSRWKADIGYSAFSGAGKANALGDKDFIAANVSFSF